MTHRDPNLIRRKARKAHKCSGDGAGSCRKFDPACVGTIQPGSMYVEYVGEAEAFHSGSAICAACFPTMWPGYECGNDPVPTAQKEAGK